MGEAEESVDTVELVLPSRAEVVAIARLVVGAIASGDPDFDEERAADLRLAVSEACTNAIQAQLARAAGNGSDVPPVLVRCVHGPGRITVTVHDDAGGFDPSALDPHPEVTDPARLDHEGGLGIPLMRMFADDLEFRPSPGGTTVRMTFRPRTPTGWST